MAYTPVSWEDYPSVNTPISANNLNHMDTQIKTNADDIEDIKEDITTLNNNLATLFSSGHYTGNIDNIDKTSFMWLDFSKATGTLPPTNTGFGIICTFRINSTIFVQVEFEYYSTAKTPIIHYRLYTNNQWYKWASFTGTLLDA